MKADADAVLFLLIDLAVIIAAARIFGWLARRAGQAAVIGEIVAGITLGPTLLGRLFPDLPAWLFPPEVPLPAIANLGLVFFMFLVGLELNPSLMRKEARHALAISLSGVAVPFTLGVALAWPLLALNNGGVFLVPAAVPPSALVFSLFTGAAMCITAFPVLARILVERGLYKSPLGTAVLCAAAIDDVIAWTLLAAVVGITRTGSPGEAGQVFLLTAAFVVFLLTVGRRLLKMLAARHEATGHLTVDQVAAVVVGLLLSAYATERIGVHAIFGAFLFGSIMPHSSRMTRELTDKIEDFTVVVLLPVFFAVTGLRTNLFAIDSWQLVGWLLVIVGVAVAGKMLGCGVAARLAGYSTRESLAIGTLMNTRGLTELVILSVGLNLGVLSDRTFAMLVVMALVTTLMAAPILNRIMTRKEMVRVLAGGTPAPVRSRVLVAVGNPDNARALVEAGLALTGGQRPAEILLVRLIPTPRAPEFRSGLRDEQMQIDRSVHAMADLVQRASASGATARAISFLSDDVGADLAHVGETQACDITLLGWYRPSLEPRVVRALVHRMLRQAAGEVVIFADRRGGGLDRNAPRGLVVASAGAAGDAHVRDMGQRLAQSLGTEVHDIVVGTTAGGARDMAAHELAERVAAVVGVDRDLREDTDFGEPATAIVAGGREPGVSRQTASVTGGPAGVAGLESAGAGRSSNSAK